MAGIRAPGHERQCKEYAKQDPESYYRDAYYLAYSARSPGLDPKNPFGYRPGPAGQQSVVSAGREYQIMGESDFLELRDLADSVEGWKLQNEDKKTLHSIAGVKGTIYCWDRPPPDPSVTSFNMVKVFAVLEGLEPWTLYDTIHDCVYRWEWDANMSEGYNVCNLDLWNDVGYYGAKSPSSFVTPRDFCNQRAWRNVDGREFIVMNRSQPHQDCPERKGCVRARSICSGYLIRPHGESGCSLTYLAQSDLKGSIPARLINSLITGQVPKTIAMMAKVGFGYNQWKQGSSHASHRPWVVPPQPWSSPQQDLTPKWVAEHTGHHLQHKGPGPPEEWYRGVPAMEWFAAGAALAHMMPEGLPHRTESSGDMRRLGSRRGSAAISTSGIGLSCDFATAMDWSDEEGEELDDDFECDPAAPLWDPRGRDHSHQCAEGAKNDPEAYYRDAYYMAYLAGATRGRDPRNPFGYVDTDEGDRFVRNDGRDYKIMGESDFLEMRGLADGMEGWKLRNEDKKTMHKVAGIEGTIYCWDRPPPDPSVTSFNMVKVFAVIAGLEPWTLYDTIHDCVYRWEWDANMSEGYNVCNLDLWNDVGYYGAKSPSSFIACRDFCNQRAWRNVDGKEFIVMNRSRPHAKCPEKKGFVRAVSICSGYLIRGHPGGCSITYVAQSDLKGSIPSRLINSLITGQVPNTIAMMAKVGLGYSQWKRSSTHAKHRPWVVPQQPWSTPQPDLLVEWLRVHEGTAMSQAQPDLGTAPDDWYKDTPASAWFMPGGPLGPRQRRARQPRSTSSRGAGSPQSAGGPPAPHPHLVPPPPVTLQDRYPRKEADPVVYSRSVQQVHKKPRCGCCLVM
eukprot:TRINITY_DN1317_c0_g1_i1.p1 TRINITY_DN1317_c0_g1~~TRINITY_DN1317_c0_g1_i1.p1  ORF type:complete len:843 (+),score=178.47 TRINITY_DN1317_c0_g1_i1:71-2599(+)